MKNTDSDTTDLNVVLHNAGKAWRDGQRAEGISTIRDALTRYPDWAEGYYQLGRYLHMDRQRSLAATAYEQSLRLDPLNIECTWRLGMLYETLGVTNQAIAIYRKAIEQHRVAGENTPDVLDLHNHLARALNDEGQTRSAIEEYRYVLSIAPDDRLASESLAIVLTSIGEFDEALTRYRVLLENNPQNTAIHWNYACALDEAGLPEEAIHEMRLVLSLIQDEPEEDKSDWEQSNVKGYLGVLLAKHSEIDEGLLLLREALALEQMYGRWHYEYGNLLDSRGQHAEALREWQLAAVFENDYYADLAKTILTEMIAP